MNNFLKKFIIRYGKIFILFIVSFNIKTTLLNAEESYLIDLEIENTTKSDENSSDFPTNPFELVEMIRRSSSLNDATKPSDAVDDALNSFNKIEDK